MRPRHEEGERLLSREGHNPEAADPDVAAGADMAAREAAFDRFVRDNLKRNYIAHFTHGMFGRTGFRLIYAPTFVPAYLHLLTGSPLLVGLGQALQQCGAALSPVIGATQVEHRRTVLTVAATFGSLMRLQILGLALAGWIFSGLPLILATFLFLFLLGVFMGGTRVAFQVLLAKVIPIHRRGTLQAWRNFAGGAIAALLSFWAGAHLIKTNAFGNGYATTFMLSFLLTSSGLSALYFLVREPEAPTVRRRMKVRERIREFPQLLADRDYRNYLIAQLLTTAGRISTPFCIIYAGQRMDVDGTALGLLSLAFLGADTLSGLLWGTIGDRYGFRVTFIGAVVVWIGALGLLILAQRDWQFMLAFFGLGAAMCGYMMSARTLVLEFGLRHDIPMRLALSITAETSVAAIGPLAGGIIASLAGLIPVFLVSIVSLTAALGVLLFRVREPRYRIMPALK